MKMKNKILGILIILINLAPLFAKENILIKSDVAADLEGYDFVSNFEITSDSGRFKNSDLMILAPNEKGFRFLAKMFLSLVQAIIRLFRHIQFS